MEETMTILHFKNDPKRINALEEMEVMKATTSDHMQHYPGHQPALQKATTTV